MPPDRPMERRTSNRHVHLVTRTWVTAAMLCASCGELWEQPMYADDGTTWVCPHCLHAASAGRAEVHRA